MMAIITENELLIRLSFFFGIFFTMALWEIAKPCRELSISKSTRWISNLGLVVLNSLVLRLVFPVAATGFAIFIADQGWGIFNNLSFPIVLEIILSLIILDCAIYWQHVIFHYSPFFWNFHKVHHADLDYDVTTGSRFHTIEIIFSMCIKFLAIAILGPSVVAVILFEVILNGMAMFNHSNISLPKKLDYILRFFVVTPDMHRVHHSVVPDELNSNFGFNLAWWDKIFKTYRKETRAGNTDMTIGLNEYRDKKIASTLWNMLKIPFNPSIK
ncbi:MAG: sterol desaturase family protein [Cellvibrionaceae bacterium]